MKKILIFLLLNMTVMCWPALAAFEGIPVRIDHEPTTLDAVNAQVAADVYGHVYVAWEDERGGIYLNYSHDNGNTWQETDTFLEYPGSGYRKDLKIMTDQSGHVYVTWIAHIGGGKNVIFSYSHDYGQTWNTQVVNVGESGWWVDDVDMDFDDSGNVCLVVSEGQSFPFNLYSNCSTDYGVTWMSSHVKINTNDPVHLDTQRDIKICMDDDGHYYTAWVDGRDGSPGGWKYMYFNYSHDYGQSWGQEQRIEPSAYAKNASNHNITCDNNGRVYVAWHSFDGQLYQDFVYYNYSTDYGVTWPSRQTFSATGNFPQIQTGGNGKVYLTWIDTSNAPYHTIRFRQSQDYGQTFNSEFQINDGHDTQQSNYVLKASNNFAAILWENVETWEGIYVDYTKDGGSTWQSQDIRVDNGVNTDQPHMAISASGNIYAVWEDDYDNSKDIYFNADKIIILPFVFQDFEPNNGSDQYGWAFNGASVELSAQVVYSGIQSWKITAPQQSGGTGIQSQSQRWDMDFQPNINDRLTFWIWADPSNGAPNNVSVKFFDNGNYFNNGFEVWTTKEAHVQEWTQIEVLFSQLPPDFDLTRVNKLEFVNFWDGIYYIDDIQLTLKDRTYQAFERCSDAADCGWAWNGTVELENNIVFEGNTSWKLVTTDNWGGTGVKSQERAYDPTEPDNQSFWHVDLNPAENDALTFWVYGLPENEMANNLNVQFFDHGDHFVDPCIVWTNQRATVGQWTQLSISFDEIPTDTCNVDLNDINKLQFQVFWPGTYYIDAIRAVKSAPDINEAALLSGTVQWNTVAEAQEYEVQESLQGADGPWQTIYTGTDTSFTYDRLTASWLRIRWSEATFDTQSERYVSDWQKPIAYQPSAVLIDYEDLRAGNISWTTIAQTSLYQVQSSPFVNGPWVDIYNGPPTTLSQQAVNGEFYRVRGFKGTITSIDEATAWSPGLTFDPDGFITAVGKNLRAKNGAGSPVVLKGINLGNHLLIEPVFTGIGGEFTPGNLNDDDDYSIREELIARFGSDDLLLNYQDAYIQEFDLDYIMRSGANLVRLPIYYRVIEDSNGNFTNFTRIDEIINLCANRGIYILLDLHGAPGAQSDEIHSGRANYNRLFEDSTQGQDYRNQTVQFWQAVAQRYKDHPMVIGYDLLNEPFGAQDHDPTFTAPNGLWTLYNNLYQAIRAIDTNHLIVMEGIPSAFDWTTLPNPTQYAWTNVMYQFHFYCFVFDPQGQIVGGCDVNGHQNFINDKLANSQQDTYNVPVFVGEFNGFDHHQNWRLHLDAYSDEAWSWAMWTYKSTPNLPNWGLFIHSEYKDTRPDVANDSEAELAGKFAKYGSKDFHVADATLTSLIGEYMGPEARPVVWKDLLGVSVAGNTITKNIGGNSWSAGAASTNEIVADGGVEFRVDGVDTHRMAGLSDENEDAGYVSIDYAIYLAVGGDVYIYESGSNRGIQTTYVDADRLAVIRTDSTIEYKKNDSIFYTSLVPSSGPLVVDSSIYSPLGTIADATIIGGTVPPNQAPVAEEQFVVVDQDAPTAITLVATDEEGSPLTYTIETVPTNGTLSGAAPGVVYTPNSGFLGSDSFTFKASDGEDDSNIAMVTINVQQPRVPVQWIDLVFVTAAGNTITKTGGTNSWNGGAASANVIAADGGMEFLANGTTKHRMAGLSTQNIDAGYATIDYAIYLAAGGDVYIYETGNNRGVQTTYIDGDVFTVERIGTTVVYKKNGVTFYTSIVPSSGTLLVDSSIWSTFGAVSNAMIFGGFPPQPNPPVAQDQIVNVIQDTPTPITLMATDQNGLPLTYSIVDNPINGVLSGTAPDVIYTPNSGYLGIDSFTFKANNGVDDSNVATVSITIQQPPQPVTWIDPVGVSVAGNSLTKTATTGWGNSGAASLRIIQGDGGINVQASETDTWRMIGLSPTNADANYASITYGLLLSDIGQLEIWELGVLRGRFGFYSSGDRVSINRVGNTVEYRHNDGVFYTSTIVSSGDMIADVALYTSGATIADATISGGVLPPNNPPDAQDQDVAVDQDTPTAITLVATDQEGSPLTYNIEINPSHGLLSGTAPDLVYTPNTGYVGNDSFTFRAYDGEDYSNTATVTITVYAPGRGPKSVEWKELIGVSESGNTITKIIGGNAWNAGAASTYEIVGDGGMNFLAEGINTHRMGGLSSGNTDAGYASIGYAIYLAVGGDVYIYENGSNRGVQTTYVDSDRFAVMRTGTTITYKKNDVNFYTSTIPSSGPLLVDTSIYSLSGQVVDTFIVGGTMPPNTPPMAEDQTLTMEQDTILPITLTATDAEGSPLTYIIETDPTNGTLSGTAPNVTYTPNSGYLGPDYFTFKANDGEDDSNIATVSILVQQPRIPVEWTNLIYVTANGNTITKTGGTNGWNAGASSTQTILANGGMEFLASGTTKHRMAGLSASDPDADYATIGYAIYLAVGGDVYIYENGNNLGVQTTYVDGDVFTVERGGTTVEYKKNGTPFLTSLVPSTGALIVDSSIWSTFGNVAQAMVFGAE